MKLKEYLAKNHFTQNSFAILSGVRQVYISRYTASKALPSVKNLQKIIKATNGEVTLNDFIIDDTEKQAS